MIRTIGRLLLLRVLPRRLLPVLTAVEVVRFLRAARRQRRAARAARAGGVPSGTGPRTRPPRTVASTTAPPGADPWADGYEARRSR